MSILESIIDRIFIFEKKPQKIGLSQLKPEDIQNMPKKEASLKNKDVKLSDLMRRVS